VWNPNLFYNSNKSPTRCNNFSDFYPEVYLELNIFPAFSRPLSGARWIELLIMAGKTPETCWALNKRQDKKLKNFCIWLVIYLNCTIMYGLTNLKFILQCFQKKIGFSMRKTYIGLYISLKIESLSWWHTSSESNSTVTVKYVRWQIPQNDASSWNN
jgi:hypothetical protein